MATDDADLLWTTRNAFYVGAYAAAIAEAADLEGLGPAACVERDTYVMRCYVELGSYELVVNDVSPDHPQPLQAVKLLAQLRSGAVSADDAKSKFADWLADPAAGADPTTRCIAAALLLADGDAAAALRAVHGCPAPEARALAVQALLACDRADLAERGAAALSGADDDGALATLAAAWAGVALGGARARDAVALFDELADRFTWTPRLAAGAAAAALRTGDAAGAEKGLLDAHAKDAKAADVLANLAAAAAGAGKPAARWLAALRSVAPDHPALARADAVAAAVDRVAAAYEVPPAEVA